MHEKIEQSTTAQANKPIVENVLTFFDETVNGEHCYFPQARQPKTPRHQKNEDHMIKTIQELSDLIKCIQSMNNNFEIYNEQEPCYTEKYSLRYLVTPQMQILFAREGKSSSSVPGHKEINNKCIAAGNIFFSKDYTKILFINHESGDFQPAAESILWPLIILSQFPFNKQESLKIQLRGPTNNILPLTTIDFAPFLKTIPEEVQKKVYEANTAINKIALTPHLYCAEDFVYLTPPSSPTKKMQTSKNRISASEQNQAETSLPKISETSQGLFNTKATKRSLQSINEKIPQGDENVYAY